MNELLAEAVDLLRELRDLTAAPTAVPLFLSADEVAAVLGVSRSAAYRLASDPSFPPAVEVPGVGRRWRRLDVERWSEKLRPARRRKAVAR